MYEHSIKSFAQRNATPESKDPQFSVDFGIAYMELGNYGDALERFAYATSRDENNSKAHYCCGVTLSIQGKHNDALAYYTSAISHTPGFAQAHSNLGCALYQAAGTSPEFAATMREKAVEEWKEAIRLDENLAEAQYNLGLFYTTLQPPNTPAALEIYHKLQRLNQSEMARILFGRTQGFKAGSEPPPFLYCGCHF